MIAMFGKYSVDMQLLVKLPPTASPSPLYALRQLNSSRLELSTVPVWRNTYSYNGRENLQWTRVFGQGVHLPALPISVLKIILLHVP
jgi:hypothetical protein